MPTTRLPSRTALSRAVNANVAWVCPAGIARLAGTVSAAASELRRLTSRTVGNVPEIVTVPVAVVASCTVAGNVRDRARVSLSTAVVMAVTGAKPEPLAVTVTAMFPSILPSSTACTAKTD